jgi:hypothetical protein
VGAPHRRHPPAAPTAHEELGPASTRLRLQLSYAALALLVLAVVVVAADAPAPLRAPVVLLAGTLVVGWPLVARLPVTLPALMALDVCVSLALEAASAFALVQTRFWHPFALGLVLSGAAAGGISVALTGLRNELARGRR